MENLNNVAENNTENTQQKPQVVLSYKIAESLCCDYPFFKDLVRIRKSKYNKKVWFFKRSKEFDKTFSELRDESRKLRMETNSLNE